MLVSNNYRLLFMRDSSSLMLVATAGSLTGITEARLFLANALQERGLVDPRGHVTPAGIQKSVNLFTELSAKTVGFEESSKRLVSGARSAARRAVHTAGCLRVSSPAGGSLCRTQGFCCEACRATDLRVSRRT